MIGCGEVRNKVDNLTALRHFALAERERDMMATKKSRKNSVTGQLGLAARSARTALSQKLARFDIYPGQDAVLLVIGEEDGISLRELADRLSVRPPTVTKSLMRLAGQGLIEKRASSEDGRRSHVYLTPDGRAIVDAVRDSRAAIERTALKGFSDKQRKALRKMLKKITKNLAAPLAPPRSVDAKADD